VSLVIGALAACTPLILPRIVYVSSDGWPYTEHGSLYWAWLVYLSILTGLSLYFFGRTLLNRSEKHSGGLWAEKSVKKVAGTALVVIVSGYLNHVGKAYGDSISVVSTIVFVLSTLYLVYILVTAFDRAFRNSISRVSNRGIFRGILMDTVLILTGMSVFIGIASFVGRQSLALSTIFVMDFMAASLAAVLAGTRHRLYAVYCHEIRRLGRQNRQPSVAQATPVQLRAPSSATPNEARAQLDPLPEVDLPIVHNEVIDQPPAQDTENPDHAEGKLLVEDNSSDRKLYGELRLALRNLHDPVRLGSSVLARGLPGDTAWQRGQVLRQQLIDTMQRLEPRGEESYANQRQYYQILWLLYSEGKSRLEIMQSLSLSERHYQRHLHEALVVFVAEWQNSGENDVDVSHPLD
jgi:uncharacterized membrane protein (DUF485 family)